MRPGSGSFLLLLTALATGLPAQWENLNPGAGGQIQNINLDPNRPGRAFFSSDMEGNYRSDDYGETWSYIGHDLSGSNSLVVAVEPGNSDRVYAGTNVSLEISDNGGTNWRAAPEILGHPIREIVINPRDVRELYALVGMRENYNGVPTPGAAPAPGAAAATPPAALAPGGTPRRRDGTSGPAQAEGAGRRPGAGNAPAQGGGARGRETEGYLFASRDRGATWRKLVFDPGSGSPQNYSLSLDATDPRVLLLAARRGLFLSRDAGESWQPVPGPAGAGACWGAALSPDGRIAYATYTREGQLTNLWAARTADFHWINLSVAARGFAPEEGRGNYWRPIIDPRSTAHEHKLLTGSTRQRGGLWEVTVRWPDSGVPSDFRWERILYYNVESDPPQPAPFDRGWESYTPRSLYYHYAPASWPGRQIWATGDQTLFAADSTRPDYTAGWDAKYTRFVQELDGVRFYANRGMACTFIFDGDAHRNYNIQANADNAVLESYDDGRSWAIGIKQPRSNAVCIVKHLDPAIVLAHTSPGYGGGATQGTLWAKRLVHYSPRDRWIRIAGGPDQVAGLPNTLYRQIEADPHRPGRVYLGTANAGLFVIDDVAALLAAAEAGTTPPPVHRIEGGPRGVAERGENLFVDPRREGTLWVAGEDAPWQAVRAADGTWRWTRLRENGQNLAAWLHAGRWLLATQVQDPQLGAAVELSEDEGRTWRVVGGFGHARTLRHRAWYRPGLNVSSYGLTGHGPHLYISYGVFSTKRPYGLFRGTLRADGQVAWEDFTGDKIFPFPVKAKVIVNEGRTDLYLATWGTGWWRRRL